MNKEKSILTAKRVLELFDYERETGRFFWRVNTGIKNLIGKEAGMAGYRGRKILHIDGVRYGSEQVVWLLENGQLPDSRIGYRDGCPGNPSISNLTILRRQRFAKDDITRLELKSMLIYDPETGVFTWKSRSIEDFRASQGWTNWERYYAGKKAGYVDKNGYVTIRIKKKLYRAHRLAWLYVHGKWPENVIDHINGNPTDNRICNLRDVTQEVNLQNMRRPTAKNKVGVLGVTFHPSLGKYAAYIKAGGKSKALGYFATANDAGEAYLRAKRKIHEGCTI